MPYSRRIVHYSPGPTDLQSVISNRAVAGCWFELNRRGGCGAGELRLRDPFGDRGRIQLGDWIAFEFEAGVRWYLGRVEERQTQSPAGITYKLQGMSIELDEVFPGGFGRDIADGTPPHRYARTDLYPQDPDYDDETVDTIDQPDDVVSLLIQQDVAPQTHITFDPNRINPPSQSTALTSLKVRGEESARTVIDNLAVQSRNASWGVDAAGTFFFQPVSSTVAATYREGLDVLSLVERRNRELLSNRLLLTGGLIYDAAVNSGAEARRVFRWRGNYIQPASREEHGERQIRLWVPWIRTRSDAREFAREFFRVYSQPTIRYFIEVANQSVLPKPWDGPIRLEARDGSELLTAEVEAVRVQFDEVPRFQMEIGPVDPRLRWAEPPHQEPTQLPSHPAPQRGGGDLVSFSEDSSSSGTSDSAGTITSE